MRFHVSRNAEQALAEIFLHWAKRAGVKVTNRLIDSITDRFELLGECPDVGISDIAAGGRCFPAGKYLIYYRKTRRRTDVLHILHGFFYRGISSPSRGGFPRRRCMILSKALKSARAFRSSKNWAVRKAETFSATAVATN